MDVVFLLDAGYIVARMEISVALKPDDRRQEIMDILMEAGSASVEDLASRFSVSKMTIHRELDDLEQAGLLR